MFHYLNKEFHTLSKIKDRKTAPIELSQSLKGRIQKETQGMDKAEVIDYSVKLTAKLLTFSATQGKLGDNKESKANCVGYARLCASICNYGFRQNHIQANAKPVVGYVYGSPDNPGGLSIFLLQ